MTCTETRSAHRTITLAIIALRDEGHTTLALELAGVAEQYETDAKMRQMKAALQECESYFEERADAEYFPDSAGPVGNEEMRLLVEVQAAIANLPNEVAA
jgi:hypothetical protein